MIVLMEYCNLTIEELKGEEMIYLSLCIPTNGIEEWVFPVLEKIYMQNVEHSLWEVVLTDNGANENFEKRMLDYVRQKDNLIYKKTNAYMFENQIEALKLANGEYLKFVNHRSLLEPGSIQWMVELIKDNLTDKPVIYLSNGVLRRFGQESLNFDLFVKRLGQYASWTTGVGVWKTDFEKIPHDHIYNKISPHSDVLFSERKKQRYVIDDRVWSKEIDTNHSKKGCYDLYKAFGCEELMITLNLFIDGDISAETFKSVKKSYEKCLSGFYLDFNILKKPCSYVTNGFHDAMGIFFDERKIIFLAYIRLLYRIIKYPVQKIRGRK